MSDPILFVQLTQKQNKEPVLNYMWWFCQFLHLHSPQGSLRGVCVCALHRFQRTPVKHYRHRLVFYYQSVTPNPALGFDVNLKTAFCCVSLSNFKTRIQRKGAPKPEVGTSSSVQKKKRKKEKRHRHVTSVATSTGLS